MSKRKILAIPGGVIVIIAGWSCHHGSSSSQSQANANGGTAGVEVVAQLAADRCQSIQKGDRPSFLK